MNMVDQQLSVQSGSLVLVEYVGDKQGSFGMRGKATRTMYRFSARPTDCQKWVQIEDARELLLIPQFRLVDAEPKPPVAEADYKPTVEVASRETPADDLTVIAGISPRRQEALAAIAIRRFENLAVARPEEIAAAVKGVGLKTAERWIVEARERA